MPCVLAILRPGRQPSLYDTKCWSSLAIPPFYSTSPRSRTSSCRFVVCCASVTLAGRKPKCPDLDSNQDHDLRRVGCDPLHHQDRLFTSEPTTARSFWADAGH